MGKVELSLQEYDQMKNDLTLYEEIMNAITSPKVSDWDIKWYIEHPTSNLSISADDIMNNLSKTAQGILRNLIQVNIDRYIKSQNIKGEFKFNPSDIDFKFGYINHIDVEKVEHIKEDKEVDSEE